MKKLTQPSYMFFLGMVITGTSVSLFDMHILFAPILAFIGAAFIILSIATIIKNANDESR